MTIIPQTQRYCPHEITTKIHSVEYYRQIGNVSYVCRKYHISKASLMRWNKLYDGTRESLLAKSHRPHSPHPNAHTEQKIKWQMDVKYVPSVCYIGKNEQKFFQYTMLEEASRKRFIYAYQEQSGYSTVDFVKRAITFFGYAPETIQTDNGGEFTFFKKTKRVHTFD